MSAKNAAAALIEFDMDAAALLPAPGELLDNSGAIALGKALRDTWTLSLAAAAGGVTERQVVAAVLQHHARCGTSSVCQGYAATIFQSRRSDVERHEYIMRRAGVAIARVRRAKTKDEKALAAYWATVWMMASGVRPFPAAQ